MAKNAKAKSDMIHELSLFSGYGGFSLALQLALGRQHVRTIGYCEIEPYCQEILKARIRDGYLDNAPIWPDVRSADFAGLRGMVDIITAGFPCQPHSVAGKRAGALDDRNLWPDTIRVIDEVGPAIVLLENVPGILANGFAGTVVGELAERGYDALWSLLSASSVGAPHARTRWWCLAYAQSQRDRRIKDIIGGTWGQQDSQRWKGMGNELGDKSSYVGDAQGEQGNEGVGGTGTETPLEAQFRRRGSSAFPPNPDDGEAWREVLENDSSLEPALRGVANGSPHRVDRLKMLGNGIVPAVAAEFLRRVAERVLP